MRKLVLGALAGLIFGGLSLALPARCQAQAFWGGEIERALRPGAYVPYNGAGFMERYNYEYGPGFYLGISPYRISTMVDLDRQERFAEFGSKYQSPWNPYGKPPLFNRLLGQTAIIEGSMPTPQPPPPSRIQFQIGAGYYFAR
jgi:hypothetical protein